MPCNFLKSIAKVGLVGKTQRVGYIADASLILPDQFLCTLNFQLKHEMIRTHAYRMFEKP